MVAEEADESATASGRGEAHAVPSGMLPDAASSNGTGPVDIRPPKRVGKASPTPRPVRPAVADRCTTTDGCTEVLGGVLSLRRLRG